MRALRLRRPTGGLWQHGDFLKLWSAETISQFGTQITGLALPLAAILVLKASAFEVGLLATLEFLPFLLFTLPAGVWVDRLRRRPILVAADLGRAALLASVPIAYAFDVLRIEHLYVVAFATGVLTVFFDVAYQSYLPSLVARDELVEGNSKLEVSRAGAQIAGPGLAGALVGLIKAPPAIALDAASFVASAAFLARIGRREEPVTRGDREARPRMLPELKEGLRYVLGHRYLRSIAASTASFNFFGSLAGAVLLVYAVRRLHLSPELIGLAMTLASIGPLIGALTATRISRRLGVGPTIILSSFVAGPAYVLVPVAPEGAAALALIVPAFALSGLANVVYNVTQVSLRQAMAPERIQGRMNAVMRFLVWGTIPLGSFAGGALASRIGLRPTIWVGALGACLPFLPVLLSPVRTLRTVPEAEPEAEPPAVAIPTPPAPAGAGES